MTPNPDEIDAALERLVRDLAYRHPTLSRPYLIRLLLERLQRLPAVRRGKVDLSSLIG
jgi:hypothetical protein